MNDPVFNLAAYLSAVGNRWQMWPIREFRRIDMKHLACLMILISTSIVLQTAVVNADENAGEAVPVTEIEMAGIDNYSETLDGFGLGGATEPSAMGFLADRGYAAVVNLRLESEEGAQVEENRAAAEQAGLDYIHLPFDSANPPPDYFEDFLAVVRDGSNHPLYIHCGSATRAAALWMTKRVLVDGWSMDLAAEEARAIAGKPDVAVAFATDYIETLKQ
jgi:uncharacterized protein (TIGR01244 family)